jgi:hypothetical protein
LKNAERNFYRHLVASHSGRRAAALSWPPNREVQTRYHVSFRAGLRTAALSP